jgi:hypothetical protein
MNAPWRITIIVLLFLGTVNAIDTTTVFKRELGMNHTNFVLTILGALMGVICIVLFFFVCYIQTRRRNALGYLEDGIETPASSGREWFSRLGRYRRDGKSKFPDEKDDASFISEKVSAIPRYLRVNSALERAFPKAPSPTALADAPLPPVPAFPQSAHLHDKKKPARMFSSPDAPTSAPLTRPESLRSIDRAGRRKVQVSPRSVVPSPLGPRKRDLLPNLFRFGGKPSPVGARQPAQWQSLSPDDLAQRMQEKRRAVAVLEAKSRVHAHHAHSSPSSSPSCEVDEQLQTEIAGLRQEVKVLNKLLPQGPPPSYSSSSF